MNEYTVTKRITLTVEPGSQVIVSDEQYKSAKDCLASAKTSRKSSKGTEK